MQQKAIRIQDYAYDLPDGRIAGFPLDHRDASKLLIFKKGEISQRRFSDLPELLPPDSLIIWNNTRVIPARLHFRRASGALIEIFLLEPLLPLSYQAIFEKQGSCEWIAKIGNQKKWKGESLTIISEATGVSITLTAEYPEPMDKSRILLRWHPGELTFAHILELFGKTPIPPYLRREASLIDKTRYQTIYADYDGSVAAPTAGLHFTDELVDRLTKKGIRFDSVTLHVGSGTFVPVKTDTIGEHEMHSEKVAIEKTTIQNLLDYNTDSLTVVGTTSLRSLESLFWLGRKLINHTTLNPDKLTVEQWDPYIDEEIPGREESLNAILSYIERHNLEKIEFNTRLIIVPGYDFQIVKRLITNFHQPSSTLLLLVSALIGDAWRKVYSYALENDFRFLSYGDSSLLEPE